MNEMSSGRRDERLARLRPDALSRERREVYDAIVGPPRRHRTDADGTLDGPFNAMLYSPAVGDALQALGAALRFRSTLPARAREMAILTVATGMGCAYELEAHTAAGRSAGLEDADLAALREGRALPSWPPFEAAVVEAARRVLARGDLADGEYASCRDAIGEVALVELVTLVGYYRLLAVQMRVFRTG